MPVPWSPMAEPPLPRDNLDLDEEDLTPNPDPFRRELYDAWAESELATPPK